MPSIAQQDYIIIDTVLDRTGVFPILKLRDALTVLSFLNKPLTALSLVLIDKTMILPASYLMDLNNPQTAQIQFPVIGSVTWGADGRLYGYRRLGSNENIEGLIAIQDQLSNDEMMVPRLRRNGTTGYLQFVNKANQPMQVAVDGKQVSVTLDSDDAIETLAVTDVAIPEGTPFVNITEADLTKLIGAPRVN